MQEGTVVLSEQSRAEFLVPVSMEGGTADLKANFYSTPGEDFIVYLTFPGLPPDFATGDNLTAWLNGSSSSSGSVLAYDISSCCISYGNGPDLNEASLYRASNDWMTPAPTTATIMIFGYNKTSGHFPTVTRLVNYTISSEIPVPGIQTIVMAASIIAAITISIGVILIAMQHVQQKRILSQK